MEVRVLRITKLKRGAIENHVAHWCGEDDDGRAVYIRFSRGTVVLAFGPSRERAVLECLSHVRGDENVNVLEFEVPDGLACGRYLLLETLRRITSNSVSWPPDEEVPGEFEMRAFLGED